MIFGVNIGHADRFSLRLLQLIRTVQVEAATVQMQEIRSQPIDLQRIGGGFVVSVGIVQMI